MYNFINFILDRRSRQQKNDIWDALGGSYCQFTLYKENKDTIEAINFLSKLIKYGIH